MKVIIYKTLLGTIYLKHETVLTINYLQGLRNNILPSIYD